MNEKKRERSVKIIINIILALALFLAVYAIVSTLIDRKQEKRNEEYIKKRNEEYIDSYPREIQIYLQKKYGKKFLVNGEYQHFSSGGPIPGKSRYIGPFTYEVKEDEPNGYVFEVNVYPQSIDNYQIDAIDDNYCWKFFTIKTKSWFENEMKDALPHEYKFACIVYAAKYFDKNTNEDTPLEFYFESSLAPRFLALYMIIPPDGIQDIMHTKEIVEQAVNGFHQNYPNAEVEFCIMKTKTEEDYKRINEREFENSYFYIFKKSLNIQDVAELEEVIKILVEYQYSY